MELLDRGDAERLHSYARRVRSGDAGNLEGQASSYYFPQVFGRSFHRSQPGWVNATLARIITPANAKTARSRFTGLLLQSAPT